MILQRRNRAFDLFRNVLILINKQRAGVAELIQSHRSDFRGQRSHDSWLMTPWWEFDHRALVRDPLDQNKQCKIKMAALLLWSSPTVTCLRGPAGWRPAAVRPVCSCRGTGNPARRPGQRDQAVVGRQRHPELLHAVTGVSTQRLCSIVSRWNFMCLNLMIFRCV